MVSTLRKRAEFLHVQKVGIKWVCKTMIIQVCPNEDLGQRRGLVVTKKLHKLAVDRNRVKRRLRAVTAEILPEYAASNYDFVFIARPQTKDAPYDTLKKDMIWCLKKLELLKDDKKAS